MNINKRATKTIFVICITIFLVLICSLMLQQSKYSSYKSINAKIVKVESRYGTGGNSKSRLYYVTYQYAVKEQQYNTKMQVFTKMGKKEGKVVVIKYNPQNPSELKDEYKSNSLLSITIFEGIFTTLLGISIFSKKKKVLYKEYLYEKNK